MGDRHNIGLLQYTYNSEQPKDILWLYSHSGFYTDAVQGFSASLAHALDEARPRWDDHTYFNRIIIHTLGDSVRGIGIGPATGDEHKRYVVDNERQLVYLMDNVKWDGSLQNYVDPIATFSFESFIKRYGKHEHTTRGEY